MSSDTTPTSPCIDAERLAAWSDGALPAAEAANVERHLSDCARCQAMLAAFVRSEPAAPAVLPFRPRLSRMWFVPLAAAAAVLIWVFVGRREGPPVSEQMARAEQPAAPTQTPAPASRPLLTPATQDAHIGPGTAAGSPSSRPSSNKPSTAPIEAPREGKQGTPAARPSSLSQATALEPPVGQVPGANRAATAAAPTAGLSPIGARSGESRLGGAGQGTVMIDQISPADARRSMPPPAAAEPPPAPRPSPPPAPMAQPRAAGAVASSPIQPTASPVAAQGQAPAIQSSTGERSFSAIAALPAPPFEIVSASPVPATAAAAGAGGRGGGGGGGRGGRPAGFTPGPPPTRWRILAPGRAEWSRDGGVSWESITIDPPVAIVAGTSPAPSVCWLIGPSGVVLRTSDGTHFDRVSFPDTSNLSSVRALDAQHATVTTTDGRVFTTADGGVTWLQGFAPPPF